MKQDRINSDAAFKKAVRLMIKKWIDYRRIIEEEKEGARSFTINSMYQESQVNKKQPFTEQYPYQKHNYICKICDHQYLELPKDEFNKTLRCETCHHINYQKVNEGVSGDRTYATMIKPTGNNYGGPDEDLIDEAYQSIFEFEREIFYECKVGFDTNKEVAERMGLTMSALETALVRSEYMILGYVKYFNKIKDDLK